VKVWAIVTRNAQSLAKQGDLKAKRAQRSFSSVLIAQRHNVPTSDRVYERAHSPKLYDLIFSHLNESLPFSTPT